MRFIRGLFWAALTAAIIVTLVLVGFRTGALMRESESQLAAMPAEGRLLETASGHVYVEEAGPEGAPMVLLVHGSIGWAGLWRDTSATLARAGYRAVAFDLPPMGYSDRDRDGDFSRVAQGKRIADLARALEAKPILVAHSFGAGPALEAALRDPALFSGIVVVSGAVGMGQDGTGARLPLPLRLQALREGAVSVTATNPVAMGPMLRRFLHRKEAATPEVIAVLNRPMTREGTTAALAAWLPSLLLPPGNADSTDPAALARITIPAALIWGDEDTATPIEQAHALRDVLPAAPLTVLEDIGHIPQIEDPEGFHAALLNTLADLGG